MNTAPLTQADRDEVTRLVLLADLQRVDPNGVYTDDLRARDGEDPLTLAEAREAWTLLNSEE